MSINSLPVSEMLNLVHAEARGLCVAAQRASVLPLVIQAGKFTDTQEENSLRE